MSRLGMTAGLTAGAALIYFPLAEMVKAAVRHPIITTIIVIFMSIIVWIDDAVEFKRVDVPTMLRMSESQIAEEYEPLLCENYGYTICRYQNMKVSFVGGYPAQIEYDADLLMSRDFSNSEDFYRHALKRTGFLYQEPVYADMNMIIWENIGGARRVILTSNSYMSPDKLTVER